MYDLSLTPTGDISFESFNYNTDECFQFNFHIASSDSLLFNFYLQPTIVENSNSLFNYNFYVYSPNNDKINKIVEDNNYLKQMIRIRLDTELGTVKGNETLGSTIYQLMHSNMHESRLLSLIKTEVKKVTADILDNADIDVQFINHGYLDYYTSIKITIIVDDNMFYFIL
jgi:hypothetical protein